MLFFFFFFVSLIQNVLVDLNFWEPGEPKIGMLVSREDLSLLLLRAGVLMQESPLLLWPVG